MIIFFLGLREIHLIQTKILVVRQGEVPQRLLMACCHWQRAQMVVGRFGSRLLGAESTGTKPLLGEYPSLFDLMRLEGLRHLFSRERLPVRSMMLLLL